MNQQDKPIEGFARRPKKIIWPELIVISDENSADERPLPPRNEHLEQVVKREALENDSTASEIHTPNDISDAGKKKKKKYKKNKRKQWKKLKKMKRRLKKDYDSDDSSSSDSDRSRDTYKNRVKRRSKISSSSSSSSSSTNSDSDSETESDSDSSDHDSKRKQRRNKKNHRRSKKSKRAGRKRHSSSKRNTKTKKSRSIKRSKRENKPTDAESTSSDSPSLPGSYGPLPVNNNGWQNISNGVPNNNSRGVNVEVGALYQNYAWHSNSQHNSEIQTPLVTISTGTTANGDVHDTQSLDQIVPPAQYVNDGEVAGASWPSLMNDIENFMTNMHPQNSPIVENEQVPIPPMESIPIGHGSQLANDQNDLHHTNPFDGSGAVQQVEPLPDLNVEHSAGHTQTPAINLQRPRRNTDKMLYLTNPERANVCVFCDVSRKLIVNHYKMKHSTKEVYVSRISPKMADRLRGNDFGRFEAKCNKNGSFWQLRAKCFFCEYAKTSNFSSWLDHIRVHTGEYPRRCTICGASVMSHSHCGHACEYRKSHHNLMTTDLMCFICKSCNFLQLEWTNMKNHLEKQHGFHKNELNNKYDEKILLPSKATVDKETAPTIAQRTNGIAATNEQGNASAINAFEDNFLNWLNNGASELNVSDRNTPQPNPPESNETNQIETKREIGWEDRLEANYLRYVTEIDNGCVVNPWFKTKISKPIIYAANLFDFYKCMHPNCIFSTNEKMAMKDHLWDHFFHSDFGREKMDPIDIHRKSRICPYCCLGPFKSTYGLITHMEDIHSACTYQCTHCYYRCIEMDSIVLHHEKFHPRQMKIVYIVNNERQFGLDNLERMESIEDSKDPEKITQFHEFECSYCNYESSKVDVMRNHLAEQHANEFMFVLRRGEKDEYIYVGGMSQWINFEFFKCEKYKAMSKYLDWDLQNIADQPEQFPLVPVPVSKENFGFEPSKLEIASDVINNVARRFVYRHYDDYVKSQALVFRCGKIAPESLIEKHREQRSYFCRICAESVDKVKSLDHLKEHQKTDCYFTAEREDLMLQHMKRKHRNKMNFYYRRCERMKIEIPIKCVFACGQSGCLEKSLSFGLAREHHSLCHKNDDETIEILRLMNDDTKISRDTFSFKMFRFCAVPTVDNHIGKEECSSAMTPAALQQHRQQYHPNDLQPFKHKLCLCKNNEVLTTMPKENN